MYIFPNSDSYTWHNELLWVCIKKYWYSKCMFSQIVIHYLIIYMASWTQTVLFLQFVSSGFEGGFILKTLHFLSSGRLSWLMYIWVIYPWNKFEEKAQCGTVLSSHSTTHTELNEITNLYLIYCEPRFSEVYCTIYLWAHFVNLEVDVKYLLIR